VNDWKMSQRSLSQRCSAAERAAEVIAPGSRRQRMGLCARLWMIALLALTALIVITVQAPASALSGAEHPTLMKGAHGPDVVALQYLPNHHGYLMSVDGVVGCGTKSKVQSPLSANGLTAEALLGQEPGGRSRSPFRKVHLATLFEQRCSSGAARPQRNGGSGQSGLVVRVMFPISPDTSVFP